MSNEGSIYAELAIKVGRNWYWIFMSNDNSTLISRTDLLIRFKVTSNLGEALRAQEVNFVPFSK